MPAELAERDATGEIAVAYDELRRFCAVPYVSSLQRHLATRPRWLLWVWTALRPAFASGRAQTAAWRAADGVAVPALSPVSRDALRVWGVDAAGEATIRAVCESFVRVAPVNLIFAGLLRRLLAGERPPGPGAPARDWPPPAMLPPLPALADLAALPEAQRAVLLSLGTASGSERFVPGLYRLLAGWPAFLAHVATVLGPRRDDAAARAAAERLLGAIDAAVPDIFATLPPLSAAPPAPSSADYPAVGAALDTYRRTSPEMVVCGRLLRDALPA